MEFAQSGPAALERISEAAGVSLILILSDINMPVMSGLELLPRAKALRPDVPVIMITAYGDAETKRKASENGARLVVVAPRSAAAKMICGDQVAFVVPPLEAHAADELVRRAVSSLPEALRALRRLRRRAPGAPGTGAHRGRRNGGA